MRSAVAVAMLALGLPHGLPLWAVTQNTGMLRITVVLTDADGNVTPIPRVVLLISDNPASSEPRRVRTGADGAVEIALRPGNYTVESDAPVTLGAKSYAWTQTINITSGRERPVTHAGQRGNRHRHRWHHHRGRHRQCCASARRFRRHLQQMARQRRRDLDVDGACLGLRDRRARLDRDERAGSP